MAVEDIIEKWQGVVSAVTIGATKEDGGTRSRAIQIGGETGLPFLSKESSMPHKPVIAFEVWDTEPVDWPPELVSQYKGAVTDPFKWAKMCVDDFRADVLCVKLQGAHPESDNKSPKEAAQFIEELLKKVSVPLIIVGCQDDVKDNEVLPAVCEASKGERCLIGDAVQDNYKTLTASVLADGHSIIAESPIDVNIAKQLNILISDMGMPLEKIVINPTIGALGYGLEYAYSIMERARLAALAGDKTVASPFICFVGQESWKTKEAKASESEFPEWGPEVPRGVIWEAMTAAALLQAGADLLVMRHPLAIEKVKKYIEDLTKHVSNR